MFGKKVRTPEEIVSKCHAALERLRVDRSSAKDEESCAKYFGEMRAALLGEGPNATEAAVQTLVKEANQVGLIGQIVSHLPYLPFETRKDAAAVFN
jgi:calcium binding protein 39